MTKPATYTLIGHNFVEGETLLNDNGIDYKALKVNDQDHVVFFSEGGFILEAVRPRMYDKSYADGHTIVVLSWDYSKDMGFSKDKGGS